uniref:Annexin n=1 Tax=Globodera pallida TaxID=36090 RepID=A0A183BM08_GLOPA
MPYKPAWPGVDVGIGKPRPGPQVKNLMAWGAKAGEIRPMDPKEEAKLEKEAEDINERLNEETFEKIIERIATLYYSQRCKLIQYYAKKFHGIDLVEELCAVHSTAANNGSVARALFDSLVESPSERDAKCLNRSINEFEGNEELLVEILLNRTSDELTAIGEAYKKTFGRQLTKDFCIVKSGKIGSLLSGLFKSDWLRRELRTDVEKAKKDALSLYEEGEAKISSEDGLFIKHLVEQHPNQLALFFDQYAKLTNRNIELAIKEQFGNLESNLLLIIVSFVRNGPLGEVAELLHKYLQSDCANERLLIHLVLAHSELDLGWILDEFRERFKIALADAIDASQISPLLKLAFQKIIKGCRKWMYE